MQELFRILKERYEENKASMLVTVVDGSGSIPRKAGAYMIVGDEGRIYGTIGGGNMEYQAILKGQSLVQEKHNHLQEYILTPNKVADLGMICGGNAKVLFYYIGTEEASAQFLVQAYEVAKARKDCWLMLPLAEGQAKIVDYIESKKHHLIVEANGQNYYAEHFFYDGNVYIFGGGHLAQELVPLLSHLDFTCIVADDREEFTKPELFPQAKKVLQIDFQAIEKSITVHPEDYIVIVTRGHLCDTDAERFALHTDAGYIGVVGSRRKAKIVYDKLVAEGFSQKQLSRVITPIGLDIGSETPAEIAVSIAAQMIQFRANK